MLPPGGCVAVAFHAPVSFSLEEGSSWFIKSTNSYMYAAHFAALQPIFRGQHGKRLNYAEEG